MATAEGLAAAVAPTDCLDTATTGLLAYSDHASQYVPPSLRRERLNGGQDDDALMKHLRTRTHPGRPGAPAHPETQIRGQWVLMLDRPTTVEGAATFLDVVTAHRAEPDALDGFDDKGLVRALGVMTDDERAIAEAFAVTDWLSWDAAAVAVALPSEAGTRFQHRRLGSRRGAPALVRSLVGRRKSNGQPGAVDVRAAERADHDR